MAGRLSHSPMHERRFGDASYRDKQVSNFHSDPVATRALNRYHAQLE